ncbi:hypothetical protein D3C84_932720 [compost metagenome]
MRDQFIAAAKAIPGMNFNGARPATVRTGPGHYQPGKIEQRITDGGQFPIDHGIQFSTVVPEHDIGQVKVTVLDTSLELLRAMIA